MPPNWAQKAHNVVSRDGVIEKRLGYDSVATLSGVDSIVGIYGAYYSDGTQQLIIVADVAGVGYGKVYVSAKGSARFDGRKQYHINFNVHNEYTYIDSILLASGTTVVSYTSDASATYSEIANGLEDTLDLILDTTDWYTTVDLFGTYYELWEESDLSSNIAVDTAQWYSSVAESPTAVWDYFSIQGKPSFAMYNDHVYMVNGLHAGIVFDGDRQIARGFPLGFPRIIPMINDTSSSYRLGDGEYRYVIRQILRTGTAGSGARLDSAAGPVYGPVVSNRSRMLLTDFQLRPNDTLHTGAIDSVIFYIYRTKVNPGRLEERDSVFFVDSIVVTDTSTIATLTFIDSIPDGKLGAGQKAYDPDLIGIDSTLSAVRWRYGAPSYMTTMAENVTYTAAHVDSAGVYYGIPKQYDTLGVVYVVTFIDTVSLNESDTSRALSIKVHKDSTSEEDKPRGYRVGLPRPPEQDTGLVCNLYRAHILTVGPDAVFDSGALVSGSWFPRPWIHTRSADDTTIVSDFYLVAQITLDSAYYTDSLRWDSISTYHKRYNRESPPARINNLFSFDGRMFGTYKSDLYFSNIDSVSAWGAFSRVSLGKHDGDQITTAFPMRGLIRVLKNKSAYNVFQSQSGDSLVWNRREISHTIGCVAGRSHAAGLGGHYYLSKRGVLSEVEGQYLERTQQIGLVSKTLDNFDNFPITTLAKAEAFYIDDKYLLNIGDTTYVYDEKADAWTTWGFTFGDATYYSVESETQFYPGDTMYFIKPGDSVLYRYGSSELDNGDTIGIQWQTGPFLVSPEEKTINKIGLWVTSSDAADNAFVGLLMGERGQTLTSTIFYTPSLTDRRYILFGVKPETQLYYSLYLGYSGTALTTNTTIDGIDIYWTPVGKRAVER